MRADPAGLAGVRPETLVRREETGAFRDMVVTHLSQILGFVAMERPDSLDARALRDAKAAVFDDLEPFVLRTGKALAESRRTVASPSASPTARSSTAGPATPAGPTSSSSSWPTTPGSPIELRVKVPGPTLALTRAPLTPDVERATGGRGLEAYERLLHDAMFGDRLLFTRSDEVERLWTAAAPMLAAPPEPLACRRGSWGPEAAAALAEPFGWRLPDHA